MQKQSHQQREFLLYTKTCWCYVPDIVSLSLQIRHEGVPEICVMWVICFQRFAIDHHLTPRQLRGSGLLLLTLGMLLTGVAMLAFAALLHVPFPEQWLPPGITVPRVVVFEQPNAPVMAWAAFAFVSMVFAGTMSLQGLWQIVFRSRSAGGIFTMLMLAVLLVAVVITISVVMGRPIGRLSD